MSFVIGDLSFVVKCPPRECSSSKNIGWAWRNLPTLTHHLSISLKRVFVHRPPPPLPTTFAFSGSNLAFLWHPDGCHNRPLQVLRLLWNFCGTSVELLFCGFCGTAARG